MLRDQARAWQRVHHWLGLDGTVFSEGFEPKSRRPPEIERLRGKWSVTGRLRRGQRPDEMARTSTLEHDTILS